MLNLHRAYLPFSLHAWLVVLILLLSLPSCVTPVHQLVLYEDQGLKIGVETDPTTKLESPSTVNRHPANVTPEEIRTLLGALEVSGWSGTLLGLIETPHPIPVFTRAELDTISGPVAKAFHQVGPHERVFFSIPGPTQGYPNTKDRTVGALFFRDDYLHVVLRDHYAFQRADPGGGEERDPRDFKGMRLWVARPAKATVVPEAEEPDWGSFEKVHLSLKVQEVLAARAVAPPVAVRSSTPSTPSPGAKPTSDDVAKVKENALKRGDTEEDLRLQIREITNANLDLRERLRSQAEELDTLKQELQRLQQQLTDKPQAGRKSSPRKPPTP